MNVMSKVVGIIMGFLFMIAGIVLLLALITWGVHVISGNTSDPQPTTYVCTTHVTDNGTKQLVCKTEV